MVEGATKIEGEKNNRQLWYTHKEHFVPWLVTLPSDTLLDVYLHYISGFSSSRAMIYDVKNASGKLYASFSTFDEMIDYALKKGKNGRILLLEGPYLNHFQLYANAKKLMEHYREVYILNFDEHF